MSYILTALAALAVGAGVAWLVSSRIAAADADRAGEKLTTAIRSANETRAELARVRAALVEQVARADRDRADTTDALAAATRRADALAIELRAARAARWPVGTTDRREHRPGTAEEASA